MVMSAMGSTKAAVSDYETTNSRPKAGNRVMSSQLRTKMPDDAANR
jgi:hypothetical protein